MEYNKDYQIEAKAFREVFNTDKGKMVLDSIRKMCQYDTPLGKEPNELLFNEGKRLVYLFIKNRVESKNE